MIQTASENEHNVLIIDNDQKVVRVLLETLAQKNIRGSVAANNSTIQGYVDQNIWDLVFINPGIIHNSSDTSAFRTLQKLKRQKPELPVLMLSDTNSAENAINALRAGFSDFLVKPLSAEKVENIIDTFISNHKINTLIQAYQNNRCHYKIVGSSPALIKTIEIAKKVAPTSTPILITGQSGTGKELIAQLIHDQSQRANAPFIKLNCAALNDSLLESELFGHERGAFTGANTRHKGRFERAHGGTLLLDEITETKPAFQAKLLRVLEQMDFERVGGSESINVNVRVISTTNTNILVKVKEGLFRSDLYYRLAGIRLNIPPLKERKEDIIQLLWHFVNLYSNETARPITSIDPTMLDIINNYHWPGNVRQLRNIVRSALIMGTGNVLSLANVPWLMDELKPKLKTGCFDTSILVGRSLENIEKNAILATLRQADGNQTKAAKVLGISDRTLRDKVKKYRKEETAEKIDIINKIR